MEAMMKLGITDDANVTVVRVLVVVLLLVSIPPSACSVEGGLDELGGSSFFFVNGKNLDSVDTRRSYAASPALFERTATMTTSGSRRRKRRRRDTTRDLDAVVVGCNWTKIGDDVDGEDPGDQSGWSLSMNEDGTVIAVGSRYNSEYAGHVRIYQRQVVSSDENNEVVIWHPLGSEINGESASDQSGFSVSLSNDGMTVAIGAYNNDGSNGNDSQDIGHVRVYRYYMSFDTDPPGLDWHQLGQDIDGEAKGDTSGYSVSLSGNGLTVAIGASWNDGPDGQTPASGHVRVHRYNARLALWEQLGSDIDGDNANDESGWSVSLSDDGRIVAIGAPKHDGSSDDVLSERGQVRVFSYDPDQLDWVQMGQDILGDRDMDVFGWSVSLARDGTNVAVGAPARLGSNGVGYVRVFRFFSSDSEEAVVAGSWGQVGDDIITNEAGDWFGNSVALSANGTTVAIGAPTSDTGTVQVHTFIERQVQAVVADAEGTDKTTTAGEWVLVVNGGGGGGTTNASARSPSVTTPLVGESDGDSFGWSVAISANGTTVAIGAVLNDGEQQRNSGHVRVYQICQLPKTSSEVPVTDPNKNTSAPSMMPSAAPSATPSATPSASPSTITPTVSMSPTPSPTASPTDTTPQGGGIFCRNLNPDDGDDDVKPNLRTRFCNSCFFFRRILGLCSNQGDAR